MSEARYETIRKKQAIGGAGTRSLSVRGLGLGPIERGRLSGGVADLPSECPFGAERGTERAALRRTLCVALSRRCGERPQRGGCAGVGRGAVVSTWSPKRGRAWVVVGAVGSGSGLRCGEARSAKRATLVLWSGWVGWRGCGFLLQSRRAAFTIDNLLNGRVSLESAL